MPSVFLTLVSACLLYHRPLCGSSASLGHLSIWAGISGRCRDAITSRRGEESTPSYAQLMSPGTHYGTKSPSTLSSSTGITTTGQMCHAQDTGRQGQERQQAAVEHAARRQITEAEGSFLNDDKSRRGAQQVYDVPFDDAEATPSTLPGVMVRPMSGFAQQAEKEELGMAETSMAAAPALLFQALLPVLPVRSPVAVRRLLA
ncbi:hypothetical protein CFC21_066493 [Triticum aestivum]|uniref:SMP domain-containing protein n=3 Tax=Triticum TaxID=4564 RepID=A0A9R1H7N9_WHEAT|nr:hypothetical protein TRIUR3_14611 [Triticum urartu]KAF7059611.1 hypothetical protein CFC21_066493 [Triticum aestivum]